MHPQNYSCRPGFFAGRRLPLLLALSLLLVGAAEVRAQNRDDHHDDHREEHHEDDRDDDEEAEEETMLRDGAWALQFQINPNFTLSSFQGGTISFKRHTSEQSAWRVGVTLDAGYNQSDSQRRSRFEDGDQGQEFEQTNSSEENGQSLSLDAQYVRYAFADRPITLFYGAGPTGGISRGNSEFQSETVEEGEVVITEEGESSSNGFNVGVAGVVGGEWFVRPDLSLSAEYRSALRYRRSWLESRQVTRNMEEDEVDIDEDEGSTDRFYLSSGSVRFGLSLYF